MLAVELRELITLVTVVDAGSLRLAAEQLHVSQPAVTRRIQRLEMDKKRREAMLHKIQQLMYDQAMFAPIVESAFLTGVGPRLAELPTITGHPYLSPYEDLKLKGR